MTAADHASAGGVTVRTAGDTLVETSGGVWRQVLDERVPERLASGDATLWGDAARPSAAARLGWLRLPQAARALLPRLADLRERVRAGGLDRVVLAGMGGSSLAPEVIARTHDVPLTVLDTTDPGQVRRALATLERTVVVVSSKSGTTVETDSHRRVFERAFRDAGLDDDELARRFVIVTDPGSPLAALAEDRGYELVLADPDVGGRYSALSAFGLVPSALAGADLAGVLDDAAALGPTLGRAPRTDGRPPRDADPNRDNPALALGVALGAHARAGRNTVVIADNGSGMAGFGDWAEQLLAESTGKQGGGLLPAVVGDCDAPGFAPGGDTHLVTLGSPTELPGTSVDGPLGAQFLAWEYATAVAGRVLGVNPFDEPNVRESKDNTGALLDVVAADGVLPVGEPAFVDGAVEVHGNREVLSDAGDLGDVLRTLMRYVLPDGYLAVMAYLDSGQHEQVTGLRRILAGRLDRPVTFGWGPRFLHSTGQYHKGGPLRGTFLQITGSVQDDLEVPGRPFTFGQLQLAQALGDLDALASRGRPAVRLHLRDRAAGLTALLNAARES